jgi:hypothetical protein
MTESRKAINLGCCQLVFDPGQHVRK